MRASYLLHTRTSNNANNAHVLQRVRRCLCYKMSWSLLRQWPAMSCTTLHYTAVHNITLLSCTRWAGHVKTPVHWLLWALLYFVWERVLYLGTKRMQLAVSRADQERSEPFPHWNRILIPSTRPALQHSIRTQYPDSICGWSLCKIKWIHSNMFEVLSHVSKYCLLAIRLT